MDFRAALKRVGARREIAVTLFWLARAEVREAGLPSGVDRTGRQFLEQKRLKQASSDTQRTLAAAFAADLDQHLAVKQGDARHAICPSAEVALSSAILAPVGEADQVKREVERLTAELTGVRAVVSGPWPPYTFAQSV